MGTIRFILFVVLGVTQLLASATPDQEREETASFFGATRLTGYPCSRCNDDRDGFHGQLSARLDGFTSRGVSAPCGGGGPHGCVSPQKDYLDKGLPLPDDYGRLDALVRVYVPRAQGRIALPKMEKMLLPLMEPFLDGSNIRTLEAGELMFCRNVYDYFATELVNALVTHPHLEELSFVSKGYHPLLLPLVEAFAKYEKGPGTLSFGRRHICRCDDDGRVRLNAALGQMPFLTSVRYSAFCGNTFPKTPSASKFLSMCLEGTSVTHLSLRGGHVTMEAPLLLGQGRFQKTRDPWVQGVTGGLGLKKEEWGVLQKSALTHVAFYNPQTGRNLMASEALGTYLKTTCTLRTLVLQGEALDQGNREQYMKAFVASVLGSTSLTSVIFDGEHAHRSFGLTDTDREAIEAHLERNRQALEVGASAILS